ncbi:MAG: hypothetical protein ACI8T1_000408 [Verrucomicrobiales bacterium]|jgi:hypothetical protein
MDAFLVKPFQATALYIILTDALDRVNMIPKKPSVSTPANWKGRIQTVLGQNVSKAALLGFGRRVAEELSPDTTELGQVIEERDPTQIRFLRHRLKGLLNTIGLGHLAEPPSNKDEDLPQWLSEIKEETASLKDWLDQA